MSEWTWEFRLGRRRQAVLGTGGIQVDRHRSLSFDCIRSQRHLVRVHEHRLQIAKNGGLPAAFDRKLWGRDVEGLFITSGLVLVFVLLFPLSSVASMGSAGFLLVYSAVNVGHLRIRKQTGAKAWPVVASAVTCLSLFVVLVYHMIATAPTSAIALGVTLAGSFVFETVYRRRTGRTFHEILTQTDPVPAAAPPTAQ